MRWVCEAAAGDVTRATDPEAALAHYLAAMEAIQAQLPLDRCVYADLYMAPAR